MRSLARRSGSVADLPGWALALACWALVACYPSEPGVVVPPLGTREPEPAAGSAYLVTASGVYPETYTVAACAVQGCDPSTCSIRQVDPGEGYTDVAAGSLRVTTGESTWRWGIYRREESGEVEVVGSDYKPLGRGTEVGQDVAGYVYLRDSQGRLVWRSPEPYGGLVPWLGAR